VKVPPGCSDGTNLRLRGQGDKGSRGGPAGDLYVVVSVDPSDEFERHHYDIHTNSEINIWDAMLGARLKVRTIDGSAEIDVPQGTQPETQVTLPGRGVPMLGRDSDRGNHIVTLKVKVPSGLTYKEVRLVKKLRESVSERVVS